MKELIVLSIYFKNIIDEFFPFRQQGFINQFIRQRGTSWSRKLEVTVERGSVVEPGLFNVARVYQRGGILYNLVLALVKILKNKDSYRNIQVSRFRDLRENCFLQSCWERVGINVGEKEFLKYGSGGFVVAEIERLYGNKIDNQFDLSIEFKKKSGFYCPIETDYEDDFKKFNVQEESSILSQLP